MAKGSGVAMPKRTVQSLIQTAIVIAFLCTQPRRHTSIRTCDPIPGTSALSSQVPTSTTYRQNTSLQSNQYPISLTGGKIHERALGATFDYSGDRPSPIPGTI